MKVKIESHNDELKLCVDRTYDVSFTTDYITKKNEMFLSWTQSFVQKIVRDIYETREITMIG